MYVTIKELTLVEIKTRSYGEQVKLLSRSIVLGNLLPVANIGQVVEEMKETVEKRVEHRLKSRCVFAFDLVL
jgi:hypothetical protein